jgi:hypothetical protein
MEIYSSFLKLAPLVLLKLLATGGFGLPEQDKDRRGRVALAGDLLLMVTVVVGGFIAIFVLGDVLAPSATTRSVVVVVGCVSLLVLAKFKLHQIAFLYRARPRAGMPANTAGGASANPGESS